MPDESSNASETLDETIKREEEMRKMLVLRIAEAQLKLEEPSIRNDPWHPLKQTLTELYRQKGETDERLAALKLKRQERIGQPDIPTLEPSEEFHRFTYGSETFVLNNTETQRAEMLWNAKARENRRVRTHALLEGTGYDKVRNLFQNCA